MEPRRLPRRGARPLQRLPLAARRAGRHQDRAYTGATVDGWFALNLSSNLRTGLGRWTVQDVSTYLKTGAVTGRTTALGPMALVVKNSTSYLTDADLTAMAAS